MEDSSKLELFLEKFLRTKNVKWLNLFIFEYYQNAEKNQKVVYKLERSEKFVAFSYHLIRLLFISINELIKSSDSDGDYCFRGYLTNGIGGKIIMLLSDLQLDLSNVSNERELVDILLRLFPTEVWEEEGTAEAKLHAYSPHDIRKIIKLTQFSDKRMKRKRIQLDLADSVPICFYHEVEDLGCEQELERYMTEECKSYNDAHYLSSPELALKISILLGKFVDAENVIFFNQTTVTRNCFKFCADMLKNWIESPAIFNSRDQSVIKLNFLELMARCFINLFKTNDKPIEVEFKQLVNLLEISEEADLVYILTVFTLNVLAQSCIKKVPKKRDIMSDFLKYKSMVLEKIEQLKDNEEYLFEIQKTLIRSIYAFRKTIIPQKKRRISKRSQNDSSCHHHHQLKDVCIFERLLIDGINCVNNFNHLVIISKFLLLNGFCCCNVDIETMRIVLRSSPISSRYLKILEKRVARMFLDKLCVYCNQKLQSAEFKEEYFKLLNNEIERRQENELYLLMHHLIKINRYMNKDFQIDFIANLIVPTFIREKILFHKDPSKNRTSKLIVSYSLQIINGASKNAAVLNNILTKETIDHLKDCTLVPLFSADACTILRNGIESCQSPEIIQQIKMILFSNLHYLIKEIMDIYEQVGLPKGICLENDDSSKSKEVNDFEVLDEQTVMVKENLSNMDVLLLNTVHWKVVYDLIAKDFSFQNDLVMNILNNFHHDLPFHIAHFALNAMLLRKEYSSSSIRVELETHSESESKFENLYERCDYLSPIIINEYDINYDLIISRSYKLFEICQNFSDNLTSESTDQKNSFTTIYSAARDKRATFKIATIHRDNFLNDNVEEHMIKMNAGSEQRTTHNLSPYYSQWFNTFKSGLVKIESKNIRDVFVKIVSRFFRADEELKAIYRLNTIKEITDDYGLKYLSSIARNCFNISSRLSDSAVFSTKMSTALEDLKLLLLQDDWLENRDALIEALHLLLGVAEIKTRSASQIMLTNLESHLTSEIPEVIFNEEFSNERTKIVFSDSEDDDSCEDDKKTEIYFTADENYDADEEYFSAHADDTEGSRSSYKTSSDCTVRNINITNEVICKLVIEILMDLSRKCIVNRELWSPDLLISLATRLSCLKEFIGNPEFLLHGFSPLFAVNDNAFASFQKSILDLISDIRTPETLRILFSLLTINTAPVELLISRIEAICNQHLTLTAFSGVRYPIRSNESTVTSTCDTYMHRSIQSYRDIHQNHKMLTPFTEASQIIPLNFLDLKIWNSEGFTISSWIDMEASADENASIHVVSLGSDRLLLAVFLNADGSLSFNIMKPNQNLDQGRGKQKINKLLIDDSAEASKYLEASDKENINKTNFFGIASAIIKDRQMPNIRTRSSLRNGMKKSMSKEDEINRRMETSKVSVKSKKHRVKSNQWTHICLSLKVVDTHLSILLTLNGTDHENLEIPVDEMLDSDAHGMLQLLFIGAQKQATEETAINYTMSNVLLFKTPLEAYLIAYLFALGPECDNFIDCEVKQVIPLREYLNLNKVTSRTSLNLFHRLQSNMILSYSVGKTNYATAFMDKRSEHGKTMDIFTIGKIPKAKKIDSMQRAVYFCGGLSSLLFLFARTVELTQDPDAQSSALFIFLKVAYSNQLLYAEFEQKRMFDLVAHVFKHGNCYRGPGVLKAILDVVYGGTMFLKRSKNDSYEINVNSDLNIQNPSLLITLLTHFNIFHNCGSSSEAGVLDLLFKSLMVTVKESHPHKDANRQCLNDHGFYGKILEFCKIHLGNRVNSMDMTQSTALTVIELLKMLSKKPPTVWSLNEIHKLLMLLHHPSESFITHDRSKFSFTLTTQKPSKSKSTSIISSKYFNFSTKIRTTSASISIPVSPTNSQRSSIGPNTTPPVSPPMLTSAEGTSPFNETESKMSKSSAIMQVAKKFKTRKFDELSESQILKMTAILKESKYRKEIKTPTKIHKKRLKSTPKSNPLRGTSTPLKHKKKLDEDEGEEIDQKLVEKFETLMSSSNINLSETNVNRYETGVSTLQEHLFLMIKEAISLFDDTRLQVELPDCIKMESLIMFANHHDPNVRTAIIELIRTIAERNIAANLPIKTNYWIHLGNQLSISPVNLKMLQSAIEWICEEKTSISEIMRAQQIKLKYKPALRILIAMIPSMVHDIQLLQCASKFLRLIIETQHDCFQLLVEQGLTMSCIKALIKASDELLIEPIQQMLEQTAKKALKSTGAMQVLWELLYGLTYAERQSKNELVREVHMAILRQLLSECLDRGNRRASGCAETMRPYLTLKKIVGNLPSSEIKTRYNLLLDRAIQYVLSWECVDELKSTEIDFVKYLIDIHFYGMHQGSTLILWSLNPPCCDEIKIFTAHRIISFLTVDSSFVISEPKLLKSLISHLMNSNASSFSDEQLKVLAKYCGTSVTQQNWNWSMTAIEKIEVIRHNASRDQLQQVDKVVYKLEPLVQTCIDSAMRITRDVIDLQNKERRRLINQLKKSQEIDFYRDWYELIQRMVHENAPWYNENLYPTTFELDETEGPGRIRIRLKRAVLNIEDRFFLDEFKNKAQYQHNRQLLDFLLHPKETERYSISDQIIFTFNGKHLTMEQEIEGEIIITDNQLIFLAARDTYTNSIICSISEIEEIWNRRYQHKEIAMEIFLKSSKNFFIIFESKYERDTVNTFMGDKVESKNSQKIEAITQQWVENKMTNYEYLVELNKISGRSYNDLMQYPVFPWTLAQFDGEFLDLTSPESYRKLNKTISTQYEDNEEHYVTNYRYLMDQLSGQQVMKPYHYSSHYSNSGTVLHFLVRLPPFTNMFLLYQDHNFDIPDRTFHSMATTFRLTSKESATDVKELVPEFYFLPDFLENNEGFNYGKRQSGEQVNDVKLPAWCENSSRLFMLIHRHALESDFVRKSLHHWIDLIFGFKQKGKAAIEAVNVFHPATYPEFQTSNITDFVERSAYETMIRTYGQMPKQIFTAPHRKSSVNEKTQESYTILRGVKGLKHGIFTGSLQLPKPKKLTAKAPIMCKQKDSKLVLVRDLNMFFVIPRSSCIMRGCVTDSFDLVLWKEIDGIIRTKALTEKRSRKIVSAPTCDPITTCSADINNSHLWFGHSSGNISVYVRTDVETRNKKSEIISKPPSTSSTALESILDIRLESETKAVESRAQKSFWNYPIILLRHQAEVTCIKICADFKIAVSIGSDGRAVIWDIQKIEYIRTIEASCNSLKSCLTHVDVSPTLGDILTVFNPKDGAIQEDFSDECFEITENNGDDFINVSVAISGKSQLRLHNINGKYLSHVFVEGMITAVCFSFVKEGTGVNVIAAALSDGSVRLYSTWNLALIREIATGCETMIKEISFSTNQYLILLTDQEIHLWGCDGLPIERPNFHDIVFVT